jgi:hypothetical protein
MRQAHDRDERMHKFVSSNLVRKNYRATLEARANDIFGVSATQEQERVMMEEVEVGDEFDEWPDEFLLLGVAQEAAQNSSVPDTTTTTTTTSETGSTEGTEETEDDGEHDDAWPIELLVG